MVGGLVYTGLFVLVGSRRDIRLYAEDGLDSVRLALHVEVGDPVHHAVVGDGEGGHLHLRRPLYEVGEAIRAVEQTEFGVAVDMDEVLAGNHGRVLTSW